MFHVEQSIIMRLADGATAPEYKTAGAAGMDLCAHLAEPLYVRPGEKVLVPTGVFIKLPDGLEAQIRPRSGISANTTLIIPNAPGTIDSDYVGEIKVLIRNIRSREGWSLVEHVMSIDGSSEILPLSTTKPSGTYVIKNGERIAQMVIAKYERPGIQLEMNFDLPNTERGSNGFGHTGVK